ncbi:hypothetical protein PC9H_010152 [Pleurotus ostreatus]|uniref:RING-type domain-containing protein n=1 Tax=Pleurotus ostreatus TaxID=5322 RepID=A0A8H7DSS0_PLEOS|nr:uncharacterized protein PC9H_010152 [Pleurotus ostreatus]KAF7424841.1 hypothetical protein PC9H_010152 [Pleurotus ostreatus]KAJ8692145.1 RING finger and transmembrane domain-containing protein 2 [Pleurotus ostreatus]
MNDTTNDRDESVQATLRGFGAGEDAYAAELGQLAGQLKAAKASSDWTLSCLIEQAEAALIAHQATVTDAQNREEGHRTELRSLKEKLDCLEGDSSRHFDDMKATINELRLTNGHLQNSYRSLLKMHTTMRVEHQSLTRINQGIQSDCDRLRANCNELQATCSVLENLRDGLALETEQKRGVIEALAEFARCVVCTSFMTRPCVVECGHVFCSACVETWFDTRATCPLCRGAMTEGRPILGFSEIISKMVTAHTEYRDSL